MPQLYLGLLLAAGLVVVGVGAARMLHVAKVAEEGHPVPPLVWLTATCLIVWATLRAPGAPDSAGWQYDYYLIVFVALQLLVIAEVLLVVAFAVALLRSISRRNPNGHPDS